MDSYQAPKGKVKRVRLVFDALGDVLRSVSLLFETSSSLSKVITSSSSDIVLFVRNESLFVLMCLESKVDRRKSRNNKKNNREMFFQCKCRSNESLRFYICFVAIRIYYHVVYIILDE